MYRTYEYGAQLTSGFEAMLNQMRLRNRLWNAFVEIERAHTEKRNGLLQVEEQAEAEQLMARLSELRKQLRATKKKLPRKTSEDPAEDLAFQIDDTRRRLLRMASIAGFIADGRLTEIENAKAGLKHLWATIKEKRKQRAAEKKEQLKQLESERRSAIAEAMRQSAADGLYWENSGDVRTHYEGHRVAAMRTGAELRFHRWDGSGKICVRWQQGTSKEAIFSSDTLLRIEPVDSLAFDSPIRSVRRKACRTTGRIRTYGENKERIDISFNLHLHRDIADGAKIRTAALVRERVADKFRYKLVISVDEPVVERRRGKSASVEFGLGNEVARWSGSDGKRGSIVLDERLRGAFAKCDDLRSLIDSKFNEAKELLSAFLKAGKVSPWLKEEAATVSSWRSTGRMRRLVEHWQRFKGDEIIFAALREWLSRHMHLWTWKRNLEDQVVAARREQYRVFAAQLAKRYTDLYIPDDNLAKAKQKPVAESTKVVVQARTRDFLARGVFRGVLINAFRLSGGRVTLNSKKIADRAVA